MPDESSQPVVYIYELQVDDAHRVKGVGTALTRHPTRWRVGFIVAEGTYEISETDPSQYLDCDPVDYIILAKSIGPMNDALCKAMDWHTRVVYDALLVPI